MVEYTGVKIFSWLKKKVIPRFLFLSAVKFSRVFLQLSTLFMEFCSAEQTHLHFGLTPELASRFCKASPCCGLSWVCLGFCIGFWVCWGFFKPKRGAFKGWVSRATEIKQSWISSTCSRARQPTCVIVSYIPQSKSWSVTGEQCTAWAKETCTSPLCLLPAFTLLKHFSYVRCTKAVRPTFCSTDRKNQRRGTPRPRSGVGQSEMVAGAAPQLWLRLGSTGSGVMMVRGVKGCL